MTNDMTRVISLSRIYVAMCNKTNFNRLDFQSCIEGVIPYEDYINIKDVSISVNDIYSLFN